MKISKDTEMNFTASLFELIGISDVNITKRLHNDCNSE